MNRCLVFNPYYAVLGGGERYTVALGQVIAESHEVTYASPFPASPVLAPQLGFPPIDVQQVQLRDVPILSAEYDLAVIVTLTVPPPSFATRSLLVVQFPRGTTTEGSRAAGRRARTSLRGYHCVVYSEFVRQCLRDRWHTNSDVLMPGIVAATDRHVPKEQIILSVGRFMAFEGDQWNSKRHDVLIDAFARLPSHVRDSWELVLVGGCAPSPTIDEHLADLARRAKGLNVSFEVNATPERLADLQARARLFWHASGFGRPDSEPEGAEHFGMSTAEAMTNGVVPLVYADGGQVEIVTEAFGRLWRTVPELVDQTTALVTRPPTELDAMGAAARAASVRFGADRFRAETLELLDRIGALKPPRRGRARLRHLSLRAGRLSDALYPPGERVFRA